jgi:hypothetical protein
MRSISFLLMMYFIRFLFEHNITFMRLFINKTALPLHEEKLIIMFIV